MTDDGAVFPDFYGETVFCDDIRHEQGGKTSYIGIYQGDIIFGPEQQFPAALPKFGFAVTFAQKRELFDPKLQVRIFLPGDAENQPSIEGELSAPDATPVGAEPHPQLITMRAILIVSPLVIKQEGRIRVRVVRQGVTYRAGGLYVRLASPTSSPNAAAPPV